MKKWHILSFVFVILICRTANAPAASPPDAGTIQREVEKQIKEQAPSPVPAPAPRPPPSPVTIPRGIKVLVKDFHITGAKLFTEEKLKSLLAGFIGKELTISELQKAAETIDDFYMTKGFIAHAQLPEQEIRNGVVEIIVVEGKLEGVDIDGITKSRLRGESAKNYIIAAQPAGEPIRISSLERGMLLLNDIPGVSATSVLQPGNEAGTSRLALKLEDTPLFTGGVSYNNGGQRSTGTSQGITYVNANNFTGIGDQLSINGLHSSGDGVDFISAAYSLPVGYSGLRLGASASGLKYKLGDDFALSGANGSAETYGTIATYPIIRGRTSNLSGSITFDHKRYLNKAAGLTTSDKTVDIGSLGLKGDIFDQFLGGGYTTYGIIFYTGNLDLGNDPDNEAATARTEGTFLKVGWNASRLQNIYDKTSLYLGLSGQFAGKNLDSSEKFILGGPYGIRAYPVNEASGDEGVLITMELRRNLISEVQLIGFMDYGHIVLNHTALEVSQGSSNTPNSYDLAGAGTGINIAITKIKLNISFNISWPIGTNPGHLANGNDNDGTHKRPRFWISAQKYF